MKKQITLLQTEITFFCVTLILFFFLFSVELVFAATPESWFAEWNDPTAKNRPLQIIHGWFGDRTTPEKLRYYKDDCGLGGLVINVATNNYLRNETEWQRLVEVVRSAKEKWRVNSVASGVIPFRQ
ncbi:MAG: hypothetical protein LBC20_03370 [Planctomycetaceae bacterium]|jgi:hypothetical protein|nr:hypothetical protein [Planctomycetaceae bacterium]